MLESATKGAATGNATERLRVGRLTAIQQTNTSKDDANSLGFVDSDTFLEIVAPPIDRYETIQ